ncbi:MAG: hypothetical protein LBQ98_00875 [Nitrososphaerota archaeon]|jgi:uncharacterized membrane protein|nr:hypothetical protein [Nitrososphaerota archaeon]
MAWNIKRRLLIGGPVVIVLGLVLYFMRHMTFALVLPVIGIVVLIVGILYRPKKKTEILSE